MWNCFPLIRPRSIQHVLKLRIALTWLLIVWSVLLVTSEEVPTNKTNISEHPVVIIVSYDGFRYDYMMKTDTPNLDQIKAEGISAAYIMNQFPTKTFPNHHSLATGVHPETHGVTDNEIFDTKLNKTLTVDDEEFFNFRSDVVPLWILNEWAHEGTHSGCMMWPGSSFGFGENKTRPTYSVAYNHSVPFETRMDIVLDWITNKTNPANLIFMYFEQPDGWAHAFGPESGEVLSAIQRMDNLTGYLIEKLKDLDIFEKVNLILLSDHGFQEVPAPNMINISGVIDTSLYDRYGGSPVYNINPREGQLDVLYGAFQKASETLNFTVFKRETTKEHWFYRRNTRRIMPLIIVADLGFVFDDYAGKNGTMSFFDKKFNVSHNVNRKYGVHGYDNNDRVMQPYFLAHGPLFRSGFAVDPFYTIDIFPLLCQILKIHEPPNNGTVGNVQMLLFKRGFHLRGPVGWVIAGSVVFALSVLLGIMYLMTNHRRHQQPLLSSANVSYRFVNNREDSENCLEETSRNNEDNGVCVMDVDEYQSLLMSSSNEEL